MSKDLPPRLTGKFCETCGQELKEYRTKRTGHKDGGVWYTRCISCYNQRRNEQDPNLHKKRYARYVELRPAWKFNTFGDSLAEREAAYAQYNKSFEEQGGVCAICKQREAQKDNYGRVKRLAIDHDHRTGKFRGLLCQRCNWVLGWVEDDVDLLAAMQAYLTFHAANIETAVMAFRKQREP